jgi:hypothetical protein
MPTYLPTLPLMESVTGTTPFFKFGLRPDFYYYLFLEPSSQENYKMKIKIKIYFGVFPVPSSQKIHKNEVKLKFYFYFFPALHH